MGDLTGGGNVIDGMSNGIVSHRSNMDVSGFIIRNIQPVPEYNYPGNGSGIYARGDHGNFRLVQQGYGTSTVNFDHCKQGIQTEYMNVTSTDNHMQSVDVGSRLDRSVNRSVDILNNTVSARYHGMDLRMNDGAYHFLVQGNTISFGDLPPNVWQFPCFGIVVSEGNGNNPDSKIIGNFINYVPKLTSNTGICLWAATKWLVAENVVQMANNSLNRLGIATSGSTNFEVSCNQINGVATTYPNNAQAAIINNMGQGGLFSCNVMDQTTNGMLFNGSTIDGNTVQGNQFHNHKWALHLGPSAIIGPQNLKGNLWYNEPAAGGWGALNENLNDIQNYPFKFNPALINGGNTEPPSWSPTNWFQQINGANYDCADDHGVDYCSQYRGRSKEGINELDERIAQDSLANNPYTEETKWMLKGGLYKKLDENPDLRDSLPDMAAFYNELQGSATAAFKAVDDGQLALYDLDSTVVAQLEANRVQIGDYMMLVKTGMALLDDSTLSATQVDSIIAGLSGYRQTIQTLTAWNNTALEVARTSKALTADGIKAANANIGTTELIETNEKMVNEIYLSVIVKEVDTFTVDQANTLYYVANQCPMVGGNAVYKARSMYRLINDTVFFDDQQLCLPHGIIVKSVRQRDVYMTGVVPNPAMDQATLVLEQPLEVAGSFVVFNTVGKEVMRLKVPTEVNRMPFNTGDLASGMYHYRVTTPSGLVGQGKWSIVR